jgi:uncharacterized RDD family membrane protein YckC
MTCPTCGSPIAATPCPVCGAEAVVAAVGAPAAEVAYAGWWRRVGATVVDNLLLFIPTYAAFLVGARAGGVVLGDLATLAVQGAYLVGLLARPDGQSVGNRVVGTRVRDVGGGPLVHAQALRRWMVVALYSSLELTGNSALLYLFALPALADCLYPLMNARRQTWHDRFADTVVVRV